MQSKLSIMLIAVLVLLGAAAISQAEGPLIEAVLELDNDRRMPVTHEALLPGTEERVWNPDLDLGVLQFYE